jgi:hypothetical protein
MEVFFLPEAGDAGSDSDCPHRSWPRPGPVRPTTTLRVAPPPSQPPTANQFSSNSATECRPAAQPKPKGCPIVVQQSEEDA